MTLRLVGHIELPPNRSEGGFDHADVHQETDRLYVAHTGNDAIDVIDTAADRYVESIPGFTGVAGALVSQSRGLVFTSNRGENTVSVFAPGAERGSFKIGVGVKPNGLAFDAARGILLAANVGDPAIPDSHSVSIVDVERRERLAEIKVPGRTRWTIYDEARELFFVNTNMGSRSTPTFIFISLRLARRGSIKSNPSFLSYRDRHLMAPPSRLCSSCRSTLMLSSKPTTRQPSHSFGTRKKSISSGSKIAVSLNSDSGY